MANNGTSFATPHMNFSEPPPFELFATAVGLDSYQGKEGRVWTLSINRKNDKEGAIGQSAEQMRCTEDAVSPELRKKLTESSVGVVLFCRMEKFGSGWYPQVTRVTEYNPTVVPRVGDRDPHIPETSSRPLAEPVKK